MANAESDSNPSVTVVAPLVPKKENITPVGSKIAELNESRAELLNGIQGLKQDLQNWRSKLDTQVKIYGDEVTEMKKSLGIEVEQLRSEFQDLRSTLQQQQDDVAASLRNLGDVSGDGKDGKYDPKINRKDVEVHASPMEDNAKEDDE